MDHGDREARSALLSIARLALYARPGGPTFAPYVKDRFGYSRTEAYRQLRCAAIEDALASHDASPIGDTTSPPTSHVRVLAEEAGKDLITFKGGEFMDITDLPLYAHLDSLIEPLARRVLAHEFNNADGVREALQAVKGLHRERDEERGHQKAVEDAETVVEAEASGLPFLAWPTEAQEAWKQRNPLPKKPPKPEYLMKRVMSLAKIIPDRSYRYQPRARQDVDIRPGAPPLPNDATDAEAAAWRESNLVHTWPPSAGDFPFLDGVMIKDRESYRHALSRLARWARFAEERIQELIDEEEADAHRKADLSILD